MPSRSFGVRAFGSVLLYSLQQLLQSILAGGGVTDATDSMLPAPTGRNGRHYHRQALSGVLLTYLQQLSAEFASRNCVYTAVLAG